jgi:hypothetical protein
MPQRCRHRAPGKVAVHAPGHGEQGRGGRQQHPARDRTQRRRRRARCRDDEGGTHGEAHPEFQRMPRRRGREPEQEAPGRARANPGQQAQADQEQPGAGDQRGGKDRQQHPAGGAAGSGPGLAASAKPGQPAPQRSGRVDGGAGAGQARVAFGGRIPGRQAVALRDHPGVPVRIGIPD